jgi:uncharacterized protein (TIGR02646 family)
MVELKHGRPPIVLSNYCQAHPNPTAADFDSLDFRPVKAEVKSALHRDQDGLCVYCEQTLAADEGQVDHIKPKGGPQAYLHLCFSYTNYAHCCINPKTCGQKKKNGLLPIEPGPGCNAEWTLSTDGTIEPIPDLPRARRHEVVKTRDMLGLNADSNLVDERRRWLANALEVLHQNPNDLPAFLRAAPFRYLFATAL